MHNLPEMPATGFVTAKWVKARYSISNSTLHQWCAEGRLPLRYRIGARAVRFSVEDLKRFEAEFMARSAKAE